MNDRIYRYVVRFDAGCAPNPFGGWCSLAICKPAIRRTAQVGDWIIGLRSMQPDHVIYAMRVEEKISLADYWIDQRFRSKRPDRCVSSDNFYRPDGLGQLVQVQNRAHGAADVDRDLSGHWVLLSREFWYFGDQSPELPTDLVHLIHQSQGHSVTAKRRISDVESLKFWLSHWATGIHGSPIDGNLLKLGTDIDAPVETCMSSCQQIAKRRTRHADRARTC